MTFFAAQIVCASDRCIEPFKAFKRNGHFRCHAAAAQAFSSCRTLLAAVCSVAVAIWRIAPVELRAGRGLVWDQGCSEAGGPEVQRSATADSRGAGCRWQGGSQEVDIKHQESVVS